ncbi:MAG TPA: DUF881 domain-containing protein [Nocardioidaceae bacterium]|jgi:uncharacterized protein YlxW (UPF0749 family)|nr:DUF881 domain-containing protein [Nocardioidaceae bacterium]
MSSSPGRDRLVASLKRPRSRGQITAAVLLAVVGFASVVQVQSQERDSDYENMREEDLVQLLNSLAGASQRAENEIEQLEQTRSSLRSDTDSRRAALEQARDRATVLGILAGTLPAVGQGIVVTVQDPEEQVGIDQMLNGIEELRDSGAEAIEINNTVRVVAQTALVDGEGGIVVDGTQLTPPYTLEVIGEPHTLERALNIYGGFVATVERPPISGKVAIEQSQNVEVATLAEPWQPEYAEPAEPE